MIEDFFPDLHRNPHRTIKPNNRCNCVSCANLVTEPNSMCLRRKSVVQHYEKVDGCSDYLPIAGFRRLTAHQFLNEGCMKCDYSFIVDYGFIGIQPYCTSQSCSPRKRRDGCYAHLSREGVWV